jgi:D-citramalate synthase
MVETFTVIDPANKPIVGDNVLHKLLVFMLMEIIKQLFSMIYFRTIWQKTSIRFGKTSGKANIEKNLQELGLKLNAEDLKLVTKLLNWETKETVTREDLPYIISDVLDSQTYQEKSSRSLCIITCQRFASFHNSLFEN